MAIFNQASWSAIRFARAGCKSCAAAAGPKKLDLVWACGHSLELAAAVHPVEPKDEVVHSAIWLGVALDRPYFQLTAEDRRKAHSRCATLTEEPPGLMGGKVFP